jgi:hypothetical protein
MTVVALFSFCLLTVSLWCCIARRFEVVGVLAWRFSCSGLFLDTYDRCREFYLATNA